MNKEQLQYFSVAYRTHNFAKAASLIPMSAQGFTKSIRSLEAELGVSLFEKDENGVQMPTAYADELMSFSDTWDLNYRQMLKSFRRIEATENREVLLCSSLGIMGFLGNTFLHEFSCSYPAFTISYQEMSDSFCDEHLLDGSFNMAFTIYPYNKDFTTVELYSNPVCLWVNEKDPLSNRDVIRFADLDNRSLAMPGADYKCHDAILARCSEHGATPHLALQSSEMFYLFKYAMEGNGLAFCTKHLAKLPFFEQMSSVRCIPLEGVIWRFGISFLPKHEFTEAEHCFFDFCKRYFPKHFGMPF